MPLQRPIASRFASLLGAVALVGVIAGCTVGPRYVRPSAPTPASYGEADLWKPAVPADTLSRGDWWRLFNDPVLDDLEHRVNISNQNIAAAEAAYRQSLALVREARAQYFPALTLDAGATRSGSGSRGLAVGTSVGGTTTTTTNPAGASTSNLFQLSLGASWEPDVWGAIRRTVENARENAQASEADLGGARLSAQALLATDYFQLRETDAEFKLVYTTVQAYQRSFEITQNQYNAKIVAKIDVLQAQTQLQTTQSQLAGLEQQRATLEHAIAMLIGAAAGSFGLPEAAWVATVPDVPIEVPSTLLQRRPDIAASERLVAAANAEIGVQEAAYFPTFDLTGSGGTAASMLSELFKTPTRIWSIGASASETLFDAGLTRARTAAARAAYDQAVANYRQTVLTSFQGVEDQLAASLIMARQYELLKQASTAADDAERITLNQYRAGQIVYTDVVVAQAAALTARRSLVQSAVARQSTAIALIQALGGGWSDQTVADASSQH
ncbi:MAG TPA: efflux transporter outer membrane subunit [Steroidobacteraceae bacterium]